MEADQQELETLESKITSGNEQNQTELKEEDQPTEYHSSNSSSKLEDQDAPKPSETINDENPQLIDEGEEDNKKIKIFHKNEAIRGNFMPAALLLEKGKIDVNAPIDDKGNTLLHLAAKFSYMDVTRTLLELFNADINVKNLEGETPLFILIKSPNKDTFLLSYFIKNEKIDLNVENNKGLTPLIYSIIYEFNSVFYFICNDISKAMVRDKNGNSLLYYAIIYDNIEVAKFLLSHVENPIATLLDNKNLGEVLIESQGERCCKYILKYYTSYLLHDYEQLFWICKNQLYEFDKYNLFNYQMINTFYHYQNSNFFSTLLFVLSSSKFSKRKIYLFEYLVKFMLLRGFSMKFRGILCLVYSICIYFGFLHLFKKHFIGLNFVLLENVFFFILVLFGLNQLYFKKSQYHLSNFSQISYRLSDVEAENRTLINTIHQAYKNNIFNLPYAGEECPICLIYKNKTTVHCNSCNKCVNNFYFHSFMTGLCLSNQNILFYLIFIMSVGFQHLLLLREICYSIMPKYVSEYLFGNFYYFLINQSIYQRILITYLFIMGVYLLYISFEIIVCIGSEIPYYLMFNSNKVAYSDILKRGKDYVGVPKICSISFKKFSLNIFKLKAN